MGFEKLTSKPPKLYKRLHVHTFLSGERSHIFFIFLSSYSAESHAYIHTLYTCSLKSTLLRYNLSRIKCTHLKCNLMNFNKCVHLLNSSLWSTHRTFLSSQKSPRCPSHPQSHLHHWIYFSDCQHHLSIIFAYAHAQERRRRRGQQRMRWLDGILEFEQALGVGNGQGGLACCSPWGCKGLDTTKWLNWND